MITVFIWRILFFSFTLFSEETQGSYSTLDSFRQHTFVKHEFHYLNVPTVGIFTVYDVFDCTFECLSNPKCFSVNLAASKGAKGEHWCELLSSDKYRKFKEYKGNMTSHHFAMKSPCASSPCQNGGTCLPNYKRDTFKCVCKQGFVGENCEKDVDECENGTHNCSVDAVCNNTKGSFNCTCKPGYYGDGKNCSKVTSCKEYPESDVLRTSKLVTLLLDSKPTSVLCHFGDFACGPGAWTPVMKIDGSKDTFRYESGYWNDTNEYNLPGGETGFDTQETKLPSYWNTSFTRICLGMKIGQQLRFIDIDKQANSLYSLIADGQYRGTFRGRFRWQMLIDRPEASLQRNCNKEGLNAANGEDVACKARIGILGTDGEDCNTCDSKLGFGTVGSPNNTNTCGFEKGWSASGAENIMAMGYILVY